MFYHLLAIVCLLVSVNSQNLELNSTNTTRNITRNITAEPQDGIGGLISGIGKLFSKVKKPAGAGAKEGAKEGIKHANATSFDVPMFPYNHTQYSNMTNMTNNTVDYPVLTKEESRTFFVNRPYRHRINLVDQPFLAVPQVSRVPHTHIHIHDPFYQ